MLIDILERDGLIIKGSGQVLHIFSFDDSLKTNIVASHFFINEGITALRAYYVNNVGNLLFVIRNRKVEYSWIDGSTLSFKLLMELNHGTEECTISYSASESRIIVYTDYDIIVSDMIASKERVSLSSKTLTIITDYGILKNIMKDTDAGISCGIATASGKVVLMKKINSPSPLPFLQWGTWDFQSMKLKLSWGMYFMEEMVTAFVSSTQNGDEFGIVCTSKNVFLVDGTGILSETSVPNFISALTPSPVHERLHSVNLNYFTAVSAGVIFYLVVDVTVKSLMLMPSTVKITAINAFGQANSKCELLPSISRISYLSGKLDRAEELRSKTSVFGQYDYCGYEDGRTVLVIESEGLGTQIWADLTIWKHFSHAALGNLHGYFCTFNSLAAPNILAVYDFNGTRTSLCAAVQNSNDHAQLSIFGNVLNLLPFFSQELDFGDVKDSQVIPVLDVLPTKPTSSLRGNLGFMLSSHRTMQSSLLTWTGEDDDCTLGLVSGGFIQEEATINIFAIRNGVILQITPFHVCAFPAGHFLSQCQPSATSLKSLWTISVHSILNKYLYQSFPKEVNYIQDKKLAVTSAVLGHNILYLAIGNFVAIIYISLDQIPFSTAQAHTGQISCVSKIDLLVEKQEIKHLHGISCSMSSGSQTGSQHRVSCVLTSFWNSCELAVHTYFTSSSSGTNGFGSGSTLYQRDTSSFTLPSMPKAAMITEVTGVVCGNTSTILAFLATSIENLYVLELILPSSPSAAGSVNEVHFQILHVLNMPNILSLVPLPLNLGTCTNPIPIIGCVAVVLPFCTELLQIQTDPPGKSWSLNRFVLFHHNVPSTRLINGQITLSAELSQLYCVWIAESSSIEDEFANRFVLYQGRINIHLRVRNSSISLDFDLRCEIPQSLVLDGTVRCLCFNEAASTVLAILDSNFDLHEDQTNETWCEDGDVSITMPHVDTAERQTALCKDIFIASLGAGCGKMTSSESLRLPVSIAMKSIFDSLQSSKSVAPMQICAMSVDPFDSGIMAAHLRWDNAANHRRAVNKEALSPLCHIICVDSWCWEEIPNTNAVESSDGPIIVNTLHFLTLTFDLETKSFSSLSHLNYDFFDVELMRYFQRQDSLDGNESFDLGSRLQLCPMLCRAEEFDEVTNGNTTEGKSFLLILTQDGKLQVLGWEREIRKRKHGGEIPWAGNQADESAQGIAVNAQDVKLFDSAFECTARVSVVASCLTVANSEYYYFFNQHEEALAGLATQSKFARDKLFHQYINEMSLGEFDLYQAVAVHDCYIVVGICLFGLKVYRLLSSPNGDLLQETGNNRKYEIKPLTETLDKSFQMMTFWTISKRGDESSGITAVVKVFGYDRSEVLTTQNTERKFMRLITYIIYSDDKQISPDDHHSMNSSGGVRTDMCFVGVPRIFTTTEVAKMVPRQSFSRRKYSSIELETWAREMDVGELIHESFDVFDSHGNICI